MASISLTVDTTEFRKSIAQCAADVGRLQRKLDRVERATDRAVRRTCECGRAATPCRPSHLGISPPP